MIHTLDRSLIYSDLLLEGYSSATKQRRNTKLGTQSVKGLYIDRRPHPLPAIYAYGASASVWQAVSFKNASTNNVTLLRNNVTLFVDAFLKLTACHTSDYTCRPNIHYLLYFILLHRFSSLVPRPFLYEQAKRTPLFLFVW